MKILLVRPRGFCAGVEMAIRCLRLVLERLGPPVFVFHEIVHNRHVVSQFESLGAVFVNEINEIPCGSVVVYSAHGVSPKVREQATRRQLRQIDSTCPLVAKVHSEAIRYAAEGYKLVLIGHAGHDEVVGVLGEAASAIALVESVADAEKLAFAKETKLAWLMQTTLSMDESSRILQRLREKFPQIVGPSTDDICYATQNRQHALRGLLAVADRAVVVGSQNSSNSRRLTELALSHSVPAMLVDDSSQLKSTDFRPHETVIVTAGASAPESAVQSVVSWMRDRFDAVVDESEGVEERRVFSLPTSVRNELVVDDLSPKGVPIKEDIFVNRTRVGQNRT